MMLSLFCFVFRFDMPDDSYRNHEAREESHASSMDDTKDDFVLNTDNFNIPMGSSVDEAAYF